MTSLEDCVQRVSLRVNNGGHKVSELSIEYNFEFGLKNLYHYYHHFDSVALLDNSISIDDSISIPKELVLWNKDLLAVYAENCPDWVNKFVDVVKAKKKNRK